MCQRIEAFVSATTRSNLDPPLSDDPKPKIIQTAVQTMHPNTPPPSSPSFTENPNPNSARQTITQTQTLHFLLLLRRITRSTAALSAARRHRRIRRAAYVSMALAGGPRRAWSRALLMLRRQKRRRSTTPCSRAGELRRLVPGGLKMDDCTLLEEAGDYIGRLRDQVRVMQEIADLFFSGKSD